MTPEPGHSPKDISVELIEKVAEASSWTYRVSGPDIYSGRFNVIFTDNHYILTGHHFVYRQPFFFGVNEKDEWLIADQRAIQYLKDQMLAIRKQYPRVEIRDLTGKLGELPPKED